MKSKKKIKKIILHIGKIISVSTIVAAILIWYYESEINHISIVHSSEINKIKTVYDSQIDNLKSMSYENARNVIEALKQSYLDEINNLSRRINQLEKEKVNNSTLLKQYISKIVELQTMINIINNISSDIIKEASKEHQTQIGFNEIKPFSIYKIPPTVRDSISQKIFVFFERLSREQGDALFIYSDFINSNFSNKNTLFPLVKESYSPLFYDFDSIDLKSSSFVNSDLRGVDLSRIIFDEKTKLPSK